MCGLTGYIRTKDKGNSKKSLSIFKRLSVIAGERGQDTAGVFLLLKRVKDGEMLVLTFKTDGSIKSIFECDEFLDVERGIRRNIFVLDLALSHTRMATVGDTSDSVENQPLISKNNEYIFFNGIVTPKDHLANLYLTDEKNDGWIFKDIDSINLGSGVGVVNLFRFNANLGKLEVYTNNGDLFYFDRHDGKYISSDNRFLENLFPNTKMLESEISVVPFAVGVTHQYFKDSSSVNKHVVIKSGRSIVKSQIKNRISETLWLELEQLIEEKGRKIKRCDSCTQPLSGVLEEKCGKCKAQIIFYPVDKSNEFAKIIDRLNASEKPVLLGLSGGRDSSFVLSELVERWGLKNLITYTFDWGVNTPYARNNVSKICAHYKVRNILVAANIRHKRKNVKSTLKAYCKNPQVGLVPLLMAGDKQFISSARKIAIDLDSGAEMFGFNPFEKTRFKEELIWKNLWPEIDDGLYGEDLDTTGQLKLLTGYAFKVMTNPSYVNSNLIDAAKGFLNYYNSGVERTNYFDFIQWNENEVNNKLEKIGWMHHPDRSTWRIGDGTSSFYNVAYCLGQGWSENDSLRANQVRAGHISFNEAVNSAKKDNIPNKEMLEWYFSVLELDPNIHMSSLISHYSKS